MLWEDFRLLEKTPCDANSARPAKLISGRTADYIVVGSSGEPQILLSCNEAHSPRAPIALEHIYIEFGVIHRIRSNDNLIEDVFTVIQLRNADAGLFTPFFMACDTVLSSLSINPARIELERVIAGLIELFSAIELPAQKTIAGLWAELWLISECLTTEDALTHWHDNSTEKFDFSKSNKAIEVKATEAQERAHEFSLEQIRDISRETKIVSIKLRRSSSGLSIENLVASILEKTSSPTLRNKLLKNVFQALGVSIENSGDIKFDPEYSRATLRTIPAEAVPAVRADVPAITTSVRFKINFDSDTVFKCLQHERAEDVLDF